jgi:hypothetical protein
MDLQITLTGNDAVDYVLWKYGVKDLPPTQEKPVEEPAPTKVKATRKEKASKITWDKDVRPLLGKLHAQLGGGAEAAKHIEEQLEAELGILPEALRNPDQKDLPELKAFLETQLVKAPADE